MIKVDNLKKKWQLVCEMTTQVYQHQSNDLIGSSWFAWFVQHDKDFIGRMPKSYF